MKWTLILIFSLAGSLGVHAQSKRTKAPPRSIEDLKDLTPLADIVVIQRKYLRKTLRAEVGVATGLLLSNPFFVNASLGATASFYIIEKHGLEFRYSQSFHFARPVLGELDTYLQIESKHLVDKMRSVYLLSYKFVPIYGKMGWVNKKIIPFETYFTIGGGIVQLECGENRIKSGRCKSANNVPIAIDYALTLGVGQNYVINRNFTATLNLSWIYYGILTGNHSQSNILISVGGSMLVPYLKVAQ